jgi:hypothetical protein
VLSASTKCLLTPPEVKHARTLPKLTNYLTKPLHRTGSAAIARDNSGIYVWAGLHSSHWIRHRRSAKSVAGGYLL